ncbi:hypothetical protein NL676_034242 [Syzygium grande]|nr:hypothetical protein NL676_034242 [Syzygium grande]
MSPLSSRPSVASESAHHSSLQLLVAATPARRHIAGATNSCLVHFFRALNPLSATTPFIAQFCNAAVVGTQLVPLVPWLPSPRRHNPTRYCSYSPPQSPQKPSSSNPYATAKVSSRFPNPLIDVEKRRERSNRL